MNHIKRSLSLLLLSSLPLVSQANVVGLSAGEFRVDETGAANYSMPISIPKGTAGVQPSVALNYSSHNLAGGPLGVGWSISGISAISRCAQTPIHDNGNIQGVQYNSQDKFCLDGQRLILKSGTYGAPGSTYRTEVDSFATITAFGGSSSNGPQYFEVKNKAGETHYYGNSGSANSHFGNHTDAFVEPGGYSAGTLARTWAIKAIVDAKKNYILYNYNKNTTKGSFYTETIEYTGNITQNRTPYAKVEFHYTSHNKGFKGYASGAHIFHDQRLYRIDTKVDNDLFRSYHLNYETSDFIEERTLLTSVQECTDTSASNCLPATQFSWQRPALATSGTTWVCEDELLLGNEKHDQFEQRLPGEFCWEEPTSTNFQPFPSSRTLATSTANRDTTKVIDINGDGYQDLVYVNGSTWYTKLGPYHSTAYSLTGIGDGKKEYAMSIDYNGDGVRDLLVADSSTSNWYAVSYQPSEVTNFFCEPMGPCEEYTTTTYKTVKNLGIVATGLEGQAQVMDVNGDGMEDIVYRSGNYLKAHINDGDGTFTANQTLYTFTGSVSSTTLNDSYTNQTANMKSASAIDINGDGRSDLIARVTTSTTYEDEFCGGEIPTQEKSKDDQATARIWDDCRPYTVTSSSYKLFVSSGNPSSPTLTMAQTLGSSSINTLRVADLNGDGLSDLLYVMNDRWYYRLSDGTQLLAARDAGLATSSSKKYLNQFIDLNYDGRADILHATSSSNWSIYFSRPTNDGEWVSFQYRGNRSFGSNAAIRFGDTTGDGKINLLTSTSNTWTEYYNRLNTKEFAINKITNGNGVDTDITYKPMTDSSVYVFDASDADINTDTFSPKSGMQLVSRVSTDSNTSGAVAVKYQYGGFLVHKKGRGNLGFQMLRTTDEQTSVVTETHYNQQHDSTNFSKARMPLYTERRRNNVLLSKSVNTLAVLTTAQGAKMPYVSKAEDYSYIYGSDGSSTHVNTTTTTSSYDTWGNLTTQTARIVDATTGAYRETKTVNNYGSGSNQQYGRLQWSEVTTNATGDTGNSARRTNYTYNSDKMLASSVLSPNTAATKVTTAYSYDSYGNKTQVSVTGYSTATGSNSTRTTKNIFDSRGRFVNYSENAFGERVTYKYNGLSASSFTGTLDNKTTTSANGISTIHYFDKFGQTTSINHPDSRTTSTTLSFCNGCVSNSYYKSLTTVSGSPDKVVYYDKWGREVATQIKGFNGTWQQSQIVYDNRGRQWKTYDPGSSNYSEFSYDALGRVEQITQPNGGIVTKWISGLLTRTTNELGQVNDSYNNGFGDIHYTIDELGNKVTFSYDADGKLTESRTRAHGKDSVITTVYDKWGRKTQTIDPIKGTWTYGYNAFGELVSQKTARNHTFTFSYDKLGRKIRSYEANEGTLCWNYGNTNHTSNKATGKLVSNAKYSGSVSCSTTTTPTFKRSFTYDSLGRSSSTTTYINGAYYTQSQTYDAFSRPLVITYPTGTSSFAVKNLYNSSGYLYEVRNNSSNALIKRIDNINARNQVTQQTYGNGVTTSKGYNSISGHLTSINTTKSGVLKQYIDVEYDLAGNVTSRESRYGTSYGTGSKYIESYNYDDLNRLTSRTISVTAGSTSLPSAFKTTQSYNYDNWGNFSYKSGAGYYKYDNSKVHKLLGIYSNSNHTGTLYSFSYDNNGNITNDGNRSFTYASFDKPTLISKSGASSTMWYGVDRELYYKEDSYLEGSKSVTYKTTYVGNYEKVVRSGGNGALTEHKYYIGDVVVTNRSNSSSDTFYLHKDHQGSVVAATNASGNVISQAIYDPFGKRTSIYQQSSIANFTYAEPTDRGYTGHKEMAALGITHMGGRIYDATIGRFLQADPNIQAPLNSQNYNRYSYVLNNPMSYTDPSGYFFKSLFKKLNKLLGKLAPIVAIVVSFYMGPWAAGFFNSAIVGGAITGFVAGGIATGTMRGAWNGALSGAMFGAISSWADGMSYGNFEDIVVNKNIGLIDKLQNYGGNFLTTGQIAKVITAHAVTGGVMADLQGGKFGHGFLSAGITKAGMGSFVSSETSITNALKSAVVAGTASAASGGKFANGAVTGAFQYSLNWATKAHNYLIEKAYGDKLSPIELAAMEAGSKYTDSMEFQDAASSHMHSMTSEVHDDPAQMAIARDKFIAAKVSEGVSTLDGTLKGNIAAYFNIGQAVHAVMDQYSPAHMGTNQHWHWTDFYKHGPFPTSLEGMRTVTDPQHHHIVDKMRNVWSPN